MVGDYLGLGWLSNSGGNNTNAGNLLLFLTTHVYTEDINKSRKLQGTVLYHQSMSESNIIQNTKHTPQRAIKYSVEIFFCT